MKGGEWWDCSEDSSKVRRQRAGDTVAVAWPLLLSGMGSTLTGGPRVLEGPGKRQVGTKGREGPAQGTVKGQLAGAQ